MMTQEAVRIGQLQNAEQHMRSSTGAIRHEVRPPKPKSVYRDCRARTTLHAGSCDLAA